MPPPVKFRKEDIVSAALDLTREKGIGAVTAREVARALGVSVGPIFTWFETMDQLRAEVCGAAKSLYREYLEHGLAGPVDRRDMQDQRDQRHAEAAAEQRDERAQERPERLGTDHGASLAFRKK